MSELYEKSMLKLELNQILEKLSAFAGSAEGKKACRELKPVSDLEEVRLLQEETAAAASLCDRKGSPGFSELCDVRDALERADRGGCLQPKELLRIAALLRCTRNVKEYAPEEETPSVLSGLFASLSPNKYLEDRIFGAILSEEEIADSASPALSDIRRHMRIQTARIRDGLQKIISSPAYSKYLRDPIITIRQGRYVVPVKSECKNDIPGMVHDVSATGSTYFVEPMSAVNANNALRELELQEMKEIERILAELSGEAAAHREGIAENIQILVQLDVIFARARFARQTRSWMPEMNEEGKIELRNARHPLIDSKKVVPVSLRLGTDFDTMIVTGPNTGGKTVTLKTIGLLTLMAECGLHIPADEGSSLSTFDSVLADIGDEQSITQSLSTFSSHMRTIVQIVNECNDRTLVLFDELGAGTDPAEGAALAMALIDYCRTLGAHVVATTHYAELKLYAMRTKGVINASCEFDVETLQPTYRLLIGIPGKSKAFAISKKLGLSDEILQKASNLISKNDQDFEDLLSQLEQQRSQMESARQEAEELRRKTEKIKQQSEEYNQQIQQEREKALEQARREGQRIIEDARIAANEASDELKALRKQLLETGDATGLNQRQSELRRNLNDAQNKLQEPRKIRKKEKNARKILVGDTVEVLKYGTKASVLEINHDGTYLLQAGILKITAKEDEIMLTEEENKYKKPAGHPAHSGRQMQTAAMSDEVDLRGMDSVEAVFALEQYLDAAMRGKLQVVRIIHGKGTGTLRAAVQQALRKNKAVKSFRLGVYGEGEDGVTIAELR